MAVVLRRHSVVLLHHDVVAFAERVVEFSVLCGEPHLASLRVVVVNLHHGSEDTVVVLTEQLRNNEREDTHCAAHHQLVNFLGVFRFFHSCGIGNVMLPDAPSLATHKA